MPEDAGEAVQTASPPALSHLQIHSDLLSAVRSGFSASWSSQTVHAAKSCVLRLLSPGCLCALLSWFHPVTIPACSSEGQVQLRDTGQGAKSSSIECWLCPCLTHAHRFGTHFNSLRLSPCSAGRQLSSPLPLFLPSPPPPQSIGQGD